MNTWQELITDEMDRKGESWADVVRSTLTNRELAVKFNKGFGLSEGAPFTLWTKNRVYFPVVYDGLEWVGSVPRDPCDEATEHMGGQ